ncbi:MAG: methyltransferase domain-containing protein [Myxococcota bacterium]|jgi:SAM-dependent methyltransferase|nr:methyltransferase domain-containing protein [Myxococcota bacterium]
MNSAAIDQDRLHSFIQRAVIDLSAGYGGVMVSIGGKLGLYKALAGAGPLSARELSTRTRCAERYVREWLNSQATSGYLTYHAVSDTYELAPEHALVLADENSPLYVPHAWHTPASMWLDEDKTLEAFKTGKGVAWGDHSGRLFCGVAAFYRNAYRAALVPEWLPALDGVVEGLNDGIEVADVGCGHGHSSVLIAEAFPKSRVRGFDVHAASIDTARGVAAEAGLGERVRFDVAGAANYPGQYGLICFFDCLHDLGDPIAAASHALERLAPGGSVMLVEPFAADRVEDNLSPVASMYYAASTAICCAHAISEGGALVLGAQAGEARLGEVFRKAGFTSFQRVAQTPFNLVFQARR